MLKLYDYWRSTASYRVRIALEYKNIPYEKVSVHLVNNGGEQHSEEYRQLNPSELVPTLALDNGETIGQSLTIIQYLEEKYPAPALLPEHIKYKALEIAGMISSDLHPLNNLRVLQYLTQTLKHTDAEKSDWYAHWLNKGFHAVETRLKQWNAEGPFALGADFTLADIFILAQEYNAARFNIALNVYPKIAAICHEAKKLAAVQRAYPQE